MQEPIPGGIRFGGAPFGPGMTTTPAYPRGDRYATESNTRPIFVPAQGPKTRNAPHGVQPQMYKYSRSPSAYGRDYGQVGPSPHVYSHHGRVKPPNPGAHAFVPTGMYAYNAGADGAYAENSFVHHHHHHHHPHHQNMTGQDGMVGGAGASFYYPPTSMVTFPDGRVYNGPPSHVAHLTSTQAGYGMMEELRHELVHRQMVAQSFVSSEMSDIPQELEGYHSLCPLEPVMGKEKGPGPFGFKTTCYKAVSMKNSVLYALRRIHGFRLSSARSLQRVEQWKKLNHPNVVSLREVFTTKQFGDHSLIFTHDYHPGAETLAAHQFASPSARSRQGGLYASSSSSSSSLARRSSQPFASGSSSSSSSSLLPENLLWTYCIQLTAAVKAIHEQGLAVRALDITKILVTGKTRLRLNCVGVMDVVTFNQVPNPAALLSRHQHEDLMALGQILLSLACNSLAANRQDQLHKSLETITLNYSIDLKNLIVCLLSSQQSMRTIADIMPMIGARFYTQIENSFTQTDLMESELIKEMENGRLFRLLAKLGTINERPEFQMDPSWSETGDRYLLKLFRDYLFHQVSDTGAPWIDLSHVIQTLNKLDSASPEQVCLVSRDEQSVVVISYERLKNCLQTAFSEMLDASRAAAAAAAAPESFVESDVPAQADFGRT